MLCDAIPSYLYDLESRSSKKYAAEARRQVEKILTACPDASPMSVIRYRRDRVTVDKVSNRTANAEVKALIAFLRWSHAAGAIPSNPLANGITRLPEREKDCRKNRRAMTDAEIERFLMASERLTPDLTRLWRTFIEGGLRYRECVGLRVEDIRGCLIHLKASRTKSGRSRVVPIRRALADELRKRAGDDGFLFHAPNGRPWPAWSSDLLRLFYRLLRAAKVDRTDPLGRDLDLHALRWTAISRMDRRGVRGSVIQRIVGHSSPVQTSHYTDLGVGDLLAELKRKAWR